MPSSPGTHWPSFLRELDATEQAWRQHQVQYPRSDAVPWMPFPIPQFITLLADAVMAAPPSQGASGAMFAAQGDYEPYGPPKFLDVGCGPGTKIRLAEAMFGLRGYGIDIVPRFVAEAQAHGVKAMLADAFEFGGPPGEPGGLTSMRSYADYQIVLVNRPSSLQDELEGLVMKRMASDSVLIAVNWRNDPGKHGWILQSQEYGDPVCGVWIKP
jgi:SAM-dependent methyltransferase